MEGIKLKRAIVALENLLCIYRNFSSLQGCWKHVAIIRMAAVFVIYLFVFFNLVISTCSHNTQLMFCYLLSSHSSLTTTITLVAVFGGVGNADSFKDLTTKMDSVHEYCSHNDTYKTSLDTLTTAVAVCAAIYILVYLIILIILLYVKYPDIRQNNDIHAYVGLMQTLVSFWREFRFNAEFFIFNVLIKMMTTLLNQLKLNLKCILESFDDSDEGIDEMSYLQIKRELEAWASAYNSLALCSGQLKKCYGTEVLVALFILMLYLILIIYHCVDTIANHRVETMESIRPALILLGHFLFATILLLYHGQEVLNKASCLIELMTKLHSKLLRVPGSNVLELRHSVKDFRRQMAVQPVKIKLLTTTTVKMSLLLLILSTALSYTIILLQFTHVV